MNIYISFDKWNKLLQDLADSESMMRKSRNEVIQVAGSLKAMNDSSIMKVVEHLSGQSTDMERRATSLSSFRTTLEQVGKQYRTTEEEIANTDMDIKNGKASRDPSSSGWWGYETSSDHPGVTAWIGKASADWKGDNAYAGVNGYLGKAEAEAKADFHLMSKSTKHKYVDGKWTEKESAEFFAAELGASAAVTAAAADGKAGIGDDLLGAEVKGEGSVGKAKAEAKGKFSVGEDGVNANVKGEAMVSAVEGKASGTINIMGIEITGKIGGFAGAAGVEGKVGIEDNKFVVDGGVAAVIGFSAGFEIGINDEGYKGIKNFIDAITFWD